jgi:hypothetical protein
MAGSSDLPATEEGNWLKATVSLIVLIVSTSIHAQPTSAWSQPGAYQVPQSTWNDDREPFVRHMFTLMSNSYYFNTKRKCSHDYPHHKQPRLSASQNARYPRGGSDA